MSSRGIETRTLLFETLLLVVVLFCGIRPALADEPKLDDAKKLDLGKTVHCFTEVEDGHDLYP